MKIVVVGASGTMGSKVIKFLERFGQDVVSAARSTGVDVLTGAGLHGALDGADAIIDVTNFGSFGTGDPLVFFKQSTRNLIKAAKERSVGHYLVLSIAGVERLVENEYFRAKLVQENHVRASGIPHTIVRSTQFYEFLNGIVAAADDNGTILLPDVRLRPIAGDDAAWWLAELAGREPRNGTFEVAGPEVAELIDLAREQLTSAEDSRPVLSDPNARYFGMEVAHDGLVPERPAALSKLTYHEWLSRSLLD